MDRLRKFILIAVVLCVVVFTDYIAAQEVIQVTVDPNIVSFHAGSRVFLRYHYWNVPFKPYIQELFTPSGVSILRDAPSDHLHHHGLMYAVAVDGVNFWEERQTSGSQLHRSFADLRADKFKDVIIGSFTEFIDWINPVGQEVLISESRTVRMYRAADLGAIFLTWQSRFDLPAGKSSAVLSGSHYFGLGMRFTELMDKNGRFFNAADSQGEVVRGDERLVQAPWCAYQAKADGNDVTVAMFGHPHNIRYPARWFFMTKPFAYLSATLGLHVEPLRITLGGPLVLNYGVVVWDGQVQPQEVDIAYNRWITWQMPQEHSD